MDIDTITVILTFVGAFAGAVFAPFGEYLFERFLGRETNKVVSGFVLLCVANAFWVIIAFLFTMSGIIASVWLISLLYFMSIMIFIAAFRAFAHSELKAISAELFRSLKWLILGNMVWVLADFAGHVQSYLSLSQAFGLALSLTLLFISMAFFLAGALALKGQVK